MKRVVNFLSFAFLSSFLLVAEATAGGNTKSSSDVKASENTVREQLANTLSNVAFQDGNEVYIYFTVSSDKGFELNRVSGQNEDLANEVKLMLSNKTINVPSNLEGKYLVKVHFTDLSSL